VLNLKAFSKVLSIHSISTLKENMMKRILLAVAALLFWGVAAQAADDTLFSTHLFAKFQVRGCTTCHDYHSQERGGIAFGSHKGRSAESCKACHRQAVTGFEHPEEWFAQPGLYESGMDARETCETIKKALHAEFKSQALLARDMKKHLFEDPRVLWGIEGAIPGSGKLPSGKVETDLVKGGMERWKAEVTTWIDGGMKCE
jgi:hypothetical protein